MFGGFKVSFNDVISKLINVIVEGMANTTDIKELEKYQRILDFLNMFVGGDK